jgi:hypothetical protein
MDAQASAVAIVWHLNFFFALFEAAVRHGA